MLAQAQPQIQNHSSVLTIFRSIPTALPAINDDKTKKRKQNIPKAVKEQLWVRDMGHVFEGKCKVSWCKNIITVFDFQCGHNIPESKGGQLAMTNLRPICGRCNSSMGNMYTIDQWNAMSPLKDPCCVPMVNSSWQCCFPK